MRLPSPMSLGELWPPCAIARPGSRAHEYRMIAPTRSPSSSLLLINFLRAGASWNLDTSSPRPCQPRVFSGASPRIFGDLEDGPVSFQGLASPVGWTLTKRTPTQLRDPASEKYSEAELAWERVSPKWGPASHRQLVAGSGDKSTASVSASGLPDQNSLFQCATAGPTAPQANKPGSGPAFAHTCRAQVSIEELIGQLVRAGGSRS